MPVFNNALAGAAGSGGAADFKIERSLRFNQADGAYLKKSIGGSATTFTVSCWVKLEGLNNLQTIFGFGSATYSDSLFYSGSNNQLSLYNGSSTSHTYSTEVFRDFSAWYHLHVKVSNGEPTLYVNGVETITTTGYNWELNGTYCNIGAFNGAGTPQYSFSGYMADFHCVEGQALDPSSFAETDADTGVWNPIKYSGTYGTNGFHLPFSPNTSLTHPNKYATQGNSATPPSDATSLTYSTGNYLATNQGVTYDAGSVRKFWVQPGSADPGVKTSNDGTSWTTVFDGSVTWNDPIEVNCRYVYMSSSGSNFGIYYDQEAFAADASGSDNHWLPKNLEDSLLYRGTPDTGGLDQYMPSGVSPATDPSQLADTTNRTYFFVVNQDNSWNLTVVATATSMTVGSSVYDSWGANDPTTTLDDGTVTPNSSGTDTSVSGKNLATNTFTGLTIGNTYTISTKNGGSGNPHRVHYVTGATVQNQPIVDTNSLIDSPTNYEADSGNNGGNYATLNRLQTGSGVTLSNGNLDLDGTSSWKSSYSTIFLSSDKWYTEYTIRSITTHSYGIMVGLAGLGTNSIESEIGSSGDSYAIQNGPGDMKVNYNGTSSGQGPQAAYAVGDVLQLAWDADNGKLFFGKNGTWINQGNPVTGANAVRTNLTGTYCFAVALLTTADKISANFGQRPFSYTPPTGYKSVCTQNLDDPLIANPSTAFDILTWEGQSGSGSRDFRGLSFTPDLAWVKTRSQAYTHVLWDSVRGPGVNKELQTDSTNQEGQANTSASGYIDAFVDGGFDTTAGTLDNDYFNRQSTTYVAWTWDAGNLATNSAYNQSQTWSGMTSTSGNYSQYSTFGPEKLFNGSTSDGWQFSGTTASAIFTPTSPISYSSQVRVYIGATGDIANTQWKVNSGSYQSFSSSGAQWLTVLTGSGTFSRFELYQNGDAYTMQMAAIEVDGKILVDPGVIPVGSLNSSVYDQSDVWSDNAFADPSSATAGLTGLTGAFDGTLANNNLSSFTGEVIFPEIQFASGVTEVIVYAYTDGTSSWYVKLNQNGTQYNLHEQTVLYGVGQVPGGGAYIGAYKLNLNETSITRFAFHGSGNHWFAGVSVNGKLLTNSNATPPNVPTIASTVRANPTAGFSITSWTGTGTAGTIAHNLNADPALLIFKNRDTATDWVVWFKDFAANERIRLNRNYEKGVDNGFSNATLPTSSVFSVGTTNVTNTSSDDYIAYCFSPVEGYSAFGTYTGNGNPNGPFVYTGFKAKFLLWKPDAATTDWVLVDSERNAYNVIDGYVLPNSNAIEGTLDLVDFCSNGFKLRTASAGNNTSGTAVVWAAFAENPFKTARAR